jgi:hypothetical protein
MPVSFFPHDEDVQTGTIQERLEILMEAAERYRGSILDNSSKPVASTDAEEVDGKKRLTPRDIKVAFNWQEIAKILREIRELPEGSTASKAAKSDRLHRLADIYEVLRAAKMPKLEAVRIALMNEAKHLRGGGGGPQVA